MNIPPTAEETYRGLSSSDAQELIHKEGYNELPGEKKRTLLDIVIETMKEPMFLLLVACGVMYLILGDLESALLLLLFVFLVIGITIYQERKVERALDALRDLSSPRSRVIRDGKQMVIPGKNVVRGDIVILSEGDRVPADVVLLSCTNITIDESLLTGESVPVRKSSWDGKSEKPRPGGDDLPYAYSSTLVTQGRGVAKVISIGLSTEVGKIGKALAGIEQEQTQLQIETGRLVKTFGLIGGIVCALVIVIWGLTRGGWIDGFLAGLSLAMALLPEEFPVILTIFLALGAWRMSRQNVLTRRMSAIQNLGSATVLCSDKTGTLTMNQMTLKKIWADGKTCDLADPIPEWARATLEFSVLASQKEPFDPMERAIRNAGIEKIPGMEDMHGEWKLMREYPLSKQLLALSHVWHGESDGYFVASKGAPEAILDLCHMPELKKKSVIDAVRAFSFDGLRVLGVAKANPEKLAEDQHDFDFSFVGLIALEDPVRPEVPKAVSECYDAGMRVVMITGDYPGTAMAVAKKTGFRNAENIITGIELEQMSDAELHARISNTSIFARVVPEQKLRIVNALKKHNEIVVMTGDGVNDAPALKAAAIGIAMGNRGTEVARESASMVLIDDNFASIVGAVRMGRRIYDNIRKAIGYVVSIHIPIAGLAILPIVLGWPIILYPVHIAFLELIIDPVCSVVYEAEPEDKGIMKRKPRKQSEPLITSKTLVSSVLRGLVVFCIASFVFYFVMNQGYQVEKARSVAFATLVLGNLGIIMSSRSERLGILETITKKNDALWVVIGTTLLLLLLVVYLPFLQELFKIGELGIRAIGLCLAGALACVIAFEVLKITERMGNLGNQESETVNSGP